MPATDRLIRARSHNRQWPRYHRPVSFTTIRMAVGRVVLVGGVLVLLFIPYLLWGTGLMTARAQAHLRDEFSAAQHQAGAIANRHPVAPKKGTVPAPEVAHVIPDPAVGSPVGVIAIPKLGLSMVVVEGTGEAQLQAGPGHYPGTPLPGEAGNAAIAGHRTTYLHPFYSLDALVAGDPIIVTTLQGIFLYHVVSSQAVDPTDVAVVGPTSTPQLTLTTCNPRYSAVQRLVVHAALVASVVVHPKAAAVPVHHDRPAAPVASAIPAKNWVAAILWGMAVVALITGVWIAAARTKSGRRALVLVAGLLTWLVVVFFFFDAVAPLLPASF
jgi:sortase A